MGWNTTVVIFNDALGTIEEDPNFGKNLAKAIRSLEEHTVVSARNPKGGCCSAAKIIEQHHADDTTCVFIGGNTGIKVGMALGYDFSSKEQQIQKLQQIADQLGFTLKEKKSF